MKKALYNWWINLVRNNKTLNRRHRRNNRERPIGEETTDRQSFLFIFTLCKKMKNNLEYLLWMRWPFTGCRVLSSSTSSSAVELFFFQPVGNVRESLSRLSRHSSNQMKTNKLKNTCGEKSTASTCLYLGLGWSEIKIPRRARHDWLVEHLYQWPKMELWFGRQVYDLRCWPLLYRGRSAATVARYHRLFEELNNGSTPSPWQM